MQRFWSVCLMLLVFVAGILRPTAVAEDLGYNRQVRPILAEYCFACHGPDSASRKADLRLDQRQAAIDAQALVPGKPEDSEAIRRILSDDPDESHAAALDAQEAHRRPEGPCCGSGSRPVRSTSRTGR